VVVALTKPLLDRGLTAADVALPLAAAAGGRAGGKPDLAIGGGPKQISPEDLAPTVHARLNELLAQR
jgi:alanyl-tRNA synthetase